jgi:Tol biopolymer transport system component
VALGLAAAAGMAWRAAYKRGPRAGPPPGHPVKPSAEEQNRMQAAAKPLSGFVVWSSCRFGNHDILMLTLPELQVRRLTRHPHVETYPRISPDGTRVAFMRSLRPWVSQRNRVEWDVFVLDLATGREQPVAEHASQPAWTEDGQGLVFVRGGREIVECRLATGRERTLFGAGRGGVPESTLFETPSVSARRGALAVTLRKGINATGLLREDGGFTRTGGGCQLTWSPDAAFLYYVDHGGKQLNAFYRIDPEHGERRLWLDLPGAFSHEYFPKLSNDGRYLVFAASAGGHEPDCADYEIFLWRTGRPAEEAVRLTFHTGNDCWPDIFLR